MHVKGPACHGRRDSRFGLSSHKEHGSLLYIEGPGYTGYAAMLCVLYNSITMCWVSCTLLLLANIILFRLSIYQSPRSFLWLIPHSSVNLASAKYQFLTLGSGFALPEASTDGG